MVNYKDRINEIIDKQDDILLSDLEVLDNIITTYPWFQAARSVYLKALKSESSPLYNKELQAVATHTADRSVLFDYITSIDFIQNKVSKQIQQQQEQLHHIEVTVEEVNTREENLNTSMDHTKTQDDDLFKQDSQTIESPIEFNSTDDHSFSEWLKLTSLKPIERENNLQNERELANVNLSAIDKFLAEKPKITPRKTTSPIQNLADLNNPKPQLMTETLAQVYAAQKNFEKAIKAYEILKLQHPEKSGFFADRIREIKILQSNS